VLSRLLKKTLLQEWRCHFVGQLLIPNHSVQYFEKKHPEIRPFLTLLSTAWAKDYQDHLVEVAGQKDFIICLWNGLPHGSLSLKPIYKSGICTVLAVV
jgi:hypothetical protein